MATTTTSTTRPADPRTVIGVYVLAGGLVGLLAFRGEVTALLWVLPLLGGLALRHRLSAPRTRARTVAAVLAVGLGGAVLGYAAATGATTPLPGVTGFGLLALVLDPGTDD